MLMVRQPNRLSCCEPVSLSSISGLMLAHSVDLGIANTCSLSCDRRASVGDIHSLTGIAAHRDPAEPGHSRRQQAHRQR